jgi:excinuclease ABC subunit C
MNDELKEKINRLPSKPGCYIWKGKRASSTTEEILYIGKAKNIKNRVTSYLSADSTKTKYLMVCAQDVDAIITSNETEALLLESNLVKKNSPPFNVRLKDDKRYPYICLTMGEPFPRLIVARRKLSPKHLYFGPFSDVGAARSTLKTIHKIFPIRKRPLRLPLKKPAKPCLNFHLNRCWAPCTGEIESDEYRLMAVQIKDFLEGRDDSVIDHMNQKMKEASSRMDYEKAAHYRNILQDIEKTQTTQRIELANRNVSFDLLTLYSENMKDFYKELNINLEEGLADLAGQFLLLRIRNGKLIAKASYPADSSAAEIDGENSLLDAFFRDYYLELQDIPEAIYFENILKNRKVWQEVLTKKAGRKVSLKSLKELSTDDNQNILSLYNMARQNAVLTLKERLLGERFRNQRIGLRHLQKFLNLSQLPRTIECYDISNIQGKYPVASGVMLKDGIPFKNGYRKYTIRGFDGADDPGMINQVINRRLKKISSGQIKMPDLIVIDGGITQLRAAKQAKANFNVDIPIISLAKKEELVQTENECIIKMDKDSPGMLILRLARDEAHRFAVSFHRKKRESSSLEKKLTSISGIGPILNQRIMQIYLELDLKSNINLPAVISKNASIPLKLAEKVANLLQGST